MTPPLYGLLADAVVVFHLSFVLFVVLGALLVARWPRWAYAHLPAVAWGLWVELSGWICPLTPLENRLRQAGGFRLRPQCAGVLAPLAPPSRPSRVLILQGYREMVQAQKRES